MGNPACSPYEAAARSNSSQVIQDNLALGVLDSLSESDLALTGEL
jgi:hypothetical protein